MAQPSAPQTMRKAERDQEQDQGLLHHDLVEEHSSASLACNFFILFFVISSLVVSQRL
jgi:hypothetical protein